MFHSLYSPNPPFPIIRLIHFPFILIIHHFLHSPYPPFPLFSLSTFPFILLIHRSLYPPYPHFPLCILSNFPFILLIHLSPIFLFSNHIPIILFSIPSSYFPYNHLISHTIIFIIFLLWNYRPRCLSPLTQICHSFPIAYSLPDHDHDL